MRTLVAIAAIVGALLATTMLFVALQQPSGSTSDSPYHAQTALSIRSWLPNWINRFGGTYGYDDSEGGGTSNATYSQTKPNHNQIICPVIASLYNSGILKPVTEGPQKGRVTIEQVKKALMDIGCGEFMSVFQAFGIVQFKDGDGDEKTRDQCAPYVSVCFWKRVITGKVTMDTERWLNIFTMNGNQAVEHGISTGVRGGATNTPDIETCSGNFPCKTRYDRFVTPCADSKGLFYSDNILCIVCRAASMGDRGGRFSYGKSALIRGWQMKAAMIGMLQAFGRVDNSRDNSLYLTTEDMRTLMMEGRFPNGWKKRSWGTSDGAIRAATRSLTCEKYAWWGDTQASLDEAPAPMPTWAKGCTTVSGNGCKVDGDCAPAGGASCIDKRCTCGRDVNGVGMCFVDGQCRSRGNTHCQWFGESCNIVNIPDPSSSENPESWTTAGKLLQ